MNILFNLLKIVAYTGCCWFLKTQNISDEICHVVLLVWFSLCAVSAMRYFVQFMRKNNASAVVLGCVLGIGLYVVSALRIVEVTGWYFYVIDALLVVVDCCLQMLSPYVGEE